VTRFPVMAVPILKLLSKVVFKSPSTTGAVPVGAGIGAGVGAGAGAGGGTSIETAAGVGLELPPPPQAESRKAPAPPSNLSRSLAVNSIIPSPHLSLYEIFMTRIICGI